MSDQPVSAKVPEKSDEEKIADFARAIAPLVEQWVSGKKHASDNETEVAKRAIPYVFWAVIIGIVALATVVAVMVMLNSTKDIPATLASVGGLIGVFFAGRASKVGH